MWKEIPDEENFQNNLQPQYDPLLIFLKKQKDNKERPRSAWIILLHQEGTV